MDPVKRESAEGEVIGAENGGVENRHRAALIVLAASALSAPVAANRYGFTGFVLVYSVAALAWLVVRKARVRFSSTVIIAIALRAIMLVPQPFLSGDVYRYLFDGRTLAAGHNPYAALPDDPRINHPELRTIYPPHAEILFALFHWLTVWRLVLIGAEVITLFLLRDRGAWAYATFPPLLFEGIWSAHVEIIAAMLLAIAVFRRSPSAAACSVGVKIIPIAALPSLLRENARVRWIAIFCAVLIAPAIPFIAAGHFMEGMRDYAMRWVFNSPAYSGTSAVLDSLHIAQHLKNAWTAIKDPMHLEPFAPFVYSHLYSDFLARCLLGSLALVGILRARAPHTGIGILLLCSPAIHPWYWLCLVPTAVASRSRWISVALCAPFSYLLYDKAPSWLVFALCYVTPIVILRREGAEGSRAR